jgi:hypothetical protein
MKKSRIVSRIQRTTTIPFLPKLPIEVWLKAQPGLKWNLVENEDDCIFQFQFRDIEQGMLVEEQRGTVYRDRLLKIKTPQELITFMNTNSCPLDLPDAIDGRSFRNSIMLSWGNDVNSQIKAKYLAPDRGPRSRLAHKTKRLQNYVPFRWSVFLKAQKKLKQAMGLPIPTLLLRHPELKQFFELKTLSITAERRDGAYYGIVTMSPSLEACYRVVAVERLFGNVEYSFCERCGDPFPVTSKHERKYCEGTCAHAVAQQAYRERNRNRPR